MIYVEIALTETVICALTLRQLIRFQQNQPWYLLLLRLIRSYPPENDLYLMT